MEKEKCEDTIDLRSGDTVTYNKIIINLGIRLADNANDARALYKAIQEINKKYNVNLFNVQQVIDWQDTLNEVSITKIEDAI